MSFLVVGIFTSIRQDLLFHSMKKKANEKYFDDFGLKMHLNLIDDIIEWDGMSAFGPSKDHF
jgi:hypothetical protein